MSPNDSLPIDASFANLEEYLDSLLDFVSSNTLFQRLCGGVHILDFLTRRRDLYESVLPGEWRDWFVNQDVPAIIHLLLRESVPQLEQMRHAQTNQSSTGRQLEEILPPESLLDYVLNVRRLALNRVFLPAQDAQSPRDLPRPTTVGMKPKKIHEVQNFAAYIDALCCSLSNSQNCPIHLIDFGSGQNYLGRALASPPYSKSIIALESKRHNIYGAQAMDVHAKVADKQRTIRNKKTYVSSITDAQPMGENDIKDAAPHHQSLVRYVETMIKDGDLSTVIGRRNIESVGGSTNPSYLVISLHSCGNLLHHGLRSIVLNQSVKAVAMVGCCYNLMTERLGPATFKLPSLRSPNRRVDQASSACDPHGFPMSHRMATYSHNGGRGIRLNITARMMACQAPQNWTRQECESFFTRHFYRALLQRILLNQGVVGRPVEDNNDIEDARDEESTSDAGPAITIGSLPKGCYTSFVAYVRGAQIKMAADPDHRTLLAKAMVNLSDEDIEQYEQLYASREKDLSILWTLMAFSATVVEAVIVVDRWLYLREQPEVAECWVEPVFEYQQSPRNLVVVGIKR